MLSIIKAGMNVASHELNVVSNNVANANSNGFKKSMTSFADIASSGHAEAFTIAAGLGAETETTRAIHSQSTVITTGKTTDLALLGDGYFMVRSPSAGASIEFTRNGAFSLDADGFLTTSDGAQVLGYPLVEGDFTNFIGNANNVAAVQIPFSRNGVMMSNLTIADDGKISVQYGGDEPEPVGTLALGKFSNPSGLRSLGNTRYQFSTEAGGLNLGAPSEVGFGVLKSGGLETSNVDMTSELTAMIKAQQQFNGVARLLQSNNDMISRFTR